MNRKKMLPLVLLAGEAGLTGYWAANMPEEEDSAVYLSDTGLYTVGSEKNLLVMVLAMLAMLGWGFLFRSGEETESGDERSVPMEERVP